MSKILEMQTLEAVSTPETTGLVSTLSIVPPCPGWPSTVTFGNC